MYKTFMANLMGIHINKFEVEIHNYESLIIYNILLRIKVKFLY